MKNCNTCRKPKPLLEFHKNSRSKDGHCGKCKICQKEYQQTQYRKDPQRYVAYQRQYAAKIREFIRQAKKDPCSDCGKKYPYCVMDFDHVRGKKLFGLATACYDSKSLKKIKAEIAKCDLVCSNCHRIRTFKRGNWKHKGPVK